MEAPRLDRSIHGVDRPNSGCDATVTDANQAGAQLSPWFRPMSLAPWFIPMMMDGLLLLMSLQLRQAEAEIQCVLL